MNDDLKTALTDLAKAINGICLGSISYTVITDAGLSLIESWNDHISKTDDQMIDVEKAVKDWGDAMHNFDLFGEPFH
jgi:hypothetical protein